MTFRKFLLNKTNFEKEIHKLELQTGNRFKKNRDYEAN